MVAPAGRWVAEIAPVGRPRRSRRRRPESRCGVRGAWHDAVRSVWARGGCPPEPRKSARQRCVGSAGRAGGGRQTPHTRRGGQGPGGGGARQPPAPPDCPPRRSPMLVAGTRPGVFDLCWRGGGKARPAGRKTAATGGGTPSGTTVVRVTRPRAAPPPPDQLTTHQRTASGGSVGRTCQTRGIGRPGDRRGGTGGAASCHSEGRHQIGTPLDARQCQLSPVPTPLTKSATAVAPPDPWVPPV